MKTKRGADLESIGKKHGKRRRNHILAIAIDKYDNGQEPLSYPVYECERLIKSLKERYEFEERNILRLYDEKATKELLRDTIYDLSGDLGPEDNLILIFAGHGVYYDRFKQGYWVPVDAPAIKSPAEAYDEFFSFQRIIDNFYESKIHHLVFVIDSCFSGTFSQYIMNVPQAKPEAENNPEEKPSRWVLTSGRKHLVVDNSPFAKAMWEVLKANQEEKLRIYGLYNEIRNKIPEDIDQTAYCTEIVEGEAKGGEFTFQLREEALKTNAESQEQAAEEVNLSELLREGSKAYYEYLEQGRFAKLRFEKILLPDAEAELLDVEVNLEEEATPFRQALQQLWQRENPHTLICGEGGMGKTVSCVRLWKELLEMGEEAPIPIFIPLNEYNAASQAEKEGRNYLYQFIAREYLDDARLTPGLEGQLKELFKVKGNNPKVMLLLDGFNEISVDKRDLMIELHEFVRRMQGVQIAVTSRYEMRNFAWTQGFERLDLLNLTDQQIYTYLKKQEVKPPENDDIIALLRNPMMLTLYTGSSQLAIRFKDHENLKFKARVTSKGELLHNFIEGQLAKCLINIKGDYKADEEYLWQSFLLHHVLPYLAYRMVEEGQFFIHSRKLHNPSFNFKTIIEEAYQYFASFEFEELYPLFEGQQTLLGFESGAKDYNTAKVFGLNIHTFLKEKLFLLTEEGDTYGFLHQNFRDFFAAVHVQRDMELKITLNQFLPWEKRVFPKSLHAAPLDYYVRQLIGELEGEQYNKPKLIGKRWSDAHFNNDNLLAQLLEQCRGIFDEEQLGYTVWNILTIWKEQRGEFSGTNLQKLYIKNLSFNGKRIVRPGLIAKIEKTFIRNNNLFTQGHGGLIKSIDFSTDGKRIITGSEDKTGKVWDIQTGTCVLTLIGHSGIVKNAKYSPDGTYIITDSTDGTTKIWDIGTGDCLLTLSGNSNRTGRIVCSPNGKRLVTVSDKIGKVWDIETGDCLLSLLGHSDIIYGIAYSPNGEHIVTSSRDYSVKIWDSTNGSCLKTLTGQIAATHNIIFSPNGKYLITNLYDKTTKIWDSETSTCLKTLKNKSVIGSVVYSPDSMQFVTSFNSNTAEVWNSVMSTCLFTLIGHIDSISCIAYSPDGKRIVTSSRDDDTVKVWDSDTGNCLMNLSARHVDAITYSPDGKWLVMNEGGKNVEVWDIDTGVCVLKLSGHSGIVSSVTYSLDGKQIVTSSGDKTIKLWDSETGVCLFNLSAHTLGVWCAALSPDGEQIVSGAISSKRARIWDVKTGSCLLYLTGHSYGISSIAYSPNGKYLVTGSFDKTAKVWDVTTGVCLLTLEGHSSEVNSTAYNPDGNQIVTGSNDKTAKVWDVTTGVCLLTLEGHSSEINSTSYSPDGNQIVTSSSDKTAKIWDITTGICLLTLEGHSSEINCAAYSPDGKRVVTGSDDKTARVWESNTGECIQTLSSASSAVISCMYNPSGHQIVTGLFNKDTKIWDAQTGECLLTLPNIPGLFIQGCDFRDLHPDSDLSEEDIAILRQYGGIFNDEDARRWEGLMEKHYGGE
jgi:WD40 repeat protein